MNQKELTKTFMMISNWKKYIWPPKVFIKKFSALRVKVLITSIAVLTLYCFNVGPLHEMLSEHETNMVMKAIKSNLNTQLVKHIVVFLFTRCWRWPNCENASGIKRNIYYLQSKNQFLLINDNLNSKHETLTQCWYNNSPPSAMLAEHCINIRFISYGCWIVS